MTDDAWAIPTTGAELLDSVRLSLTRYVVLPSTESTIAIVLWVAASHAQTAWQAAPRLVVKSPEKRCGKTRLLDIVEALCCKPFITFNATVAAVVRSIREDDPPTLLVDEADAIWSRAKTSDGAEDLRALLNAGFQRNRPVIRCQGPLQIPTAFPSFAFCALAGIGDTIPDTVTDRAVVVRMRRRAPGETVSSFRRRDAVPLNALRDELSKWIVGAVDELRDARPAIPVEDRAADVWEPLLAVADLAGGEWPALARQACLVMTSQADEDDADASLSMRLLADLRDVFVEGCDRMHSAAIVEALAKIEDGPWADYFGRTFTVRDLTNRLKGYGLKAEKQLKIGDVNRSGFTRDQLHDVWRRYLPPDPSTSSTRSTSQVRAVDQITEVDIEGLPAAEGLPADQASRPGRPGRPSPDDESDGDKPERLEFDRLMTASDAAADGQCDFCGLPLHQLLIDSGQTLHVTCAEAMAS
jgi:Protein of unknown function (DUF3631)